MRRGKEADWDRLLDIMYDPRALLEVLDAAGVWRAGMVSYPSPEVMGFTDSTNAHTANYARVNPERLLPYGGVHPRHTSDPAGDVDRLIDLGIRLLKIHPPHQLFPANAYTEGLTPLEYMRRYGSYEIASGIGPLHESPVDREELAEDVRVDAHGRVYSRSPAPTRVNMSPTAEPDRDDERGQRLLVIVFDGLVPELVGYRVTPVVDAGGGFGGCVVVGADDRTQQGTRPVDLLDAPQQFGRNLRCAELPIAQPAPECLDGERRDHRAGRPPGTGS